MEGVKKNGVLIGARKQINFIEGTNVTIDIDDDPSPDGNNDIDVTINSSGSGGSGGTPDDNSVTSAKIVDGAIVDADVNAAAAIAQTKTGALTGDVTKASGSAATVLAAGSATALDSGTLNAARTPAFTGDVTKPSGSGVTTLAAGSASVLNSGTLPAARMPALTGDVTTVSGAVATTIGAGKVTSAMLASGVAGAAGTTSIGRSVIVRKASNETINNSNTLQDDDELLFAIAASEIWTVQVVLIVTSVSTTSDFKATFTVPSGCAMYANYEGNASNNISSWGATASGASPTALGTTSGTSLGAVGSANLTYGVMIRGVFINGATPGSVTLQWSQNTQTVENTVVVAGSHMIGWRLA